METTSPRKCKSCRLTLPATEFYSYKGIAHAYPNCILCRKAQNRAYYRKKKNIIRPFTPEREPVSWKNLRDVKAITDGMKSAALFELKILLQPFNNPNSKSGVLEIKRRATDDYFICSSEDLLGVRSGIFTAKGLAQFLAHHDSVICSRFMRRFGGPQ